ncbi:UDP-glucose dehydrogenase family protein [Estrella lausannensis]|uniref:UDP-glucose 6-dehydrogenase n=1 Tax=Estrella lausannensis TaxID=483423 RepID=A0A0H5E4F3_9BACT|nr:UDP-glucose/GDP-mannose dehydrogenase family protein [Estrella lausannensis]CRX38085.1 Putative UDP-glucose 6-dehydrogenase [Estrella lausannensis]
MEILIIGTGYVGLVTGTCMAEMGHHVICLDINEEKVAQLNQGIIPIYEPGLHELLMRNVASGRLKFTSSYPQSLTDSKVCFLCVDTPVAADGSANLHQIRSASAAIGAHMSGDLLIVVKSTVPPGTASVVQKTVQEALDERGVLYGFDVVSNPEFLKEGNAVNDCLKPDRVVIGTNRAESSEIMKEIYAPFMLNHERLMIMDVASAEITKYASNIMLAARISLMNELAGICEKVGANIDKVRLGVGSDSRIGYQFLYAGAGYGGSCLPKDVKAMISFANGLGYNAEMLQSINRVNERQKHVIFGKMKAYFEKAGGLAGKTFAILGLSFKPDTDDLREASALVLIEELLKAGASVRLFDPVAMPAAKKAVPPGERVFYAKDEISAADGCDAIVLMTEWKQFRFLDFEKVSTVLKKMVFFDGRNQYSPDKMQKIGFDYISIGKKNAYADSLKKTETQIPVTP